MRRITRHFLAACLLLMAGTQLWAQNGAGHWLYQFVPDGGEVEVTVDVKDTPGEEEGGTLPPWVIPTAIGLVGGALVGRAIRKRRKAKGDEGPEDNGPSEEEEQPQEEEEEAPSTFKMIIYKEFGNTLTLGAAPRIVGARIEEITARGQHKERPDLTAKITVEEGAYIKISQVGLTSRYRCAEIRVDEAPPKEPKTGYFYFCTTTWVAACAPGWCSRLKTAA